MSFDDYENEVLELAEGEDVDDGYNHYQTIADGYFGIPMEASGFLTHPYTKAFHRLNEAGIDFLHRFIQMSDAGVQRFRHEALSFFREVMGVDRIDPQFFWSNDIGDTL